MSKVNAKYIKFGIGVNDVNSQQIPANYTATNYVPVNVDSEGTDKLSAHLKGINNSLPPIGDINPTTFNLSNNITSPSDVTGFNFNNTTVRSFKAFCYVSIDASSDLYESFELQGIQKNSGWVLVYSSLGDNSNVIFSINSSGQIQYTSGNYSSFSSGKIVFRAQILAI